MNLNYYLEIKIIQDLDFVSKTLYRLNDSKEWLIKDTFFNYLYQLQSDYNNFIRKINPDDLYFSKLIFTIGCSIPNYSQTFLELSYNKSTKRISILSYNSTPYKWMLEMLENENESND